MVLKYKSISRKTWNDMKKLKYISKGRDGIMRGLFRTKTGATSIPVRVRKRRRK